MVPRGVCISSYVIAAGCCVADDDENEDEDGAAITSGIASGRRNGNIYARMLVGADYSLNPRHRL